jgi:site-specific recombinase XerD
MFADFVRRIRQGLVYQKRPRFGNRPLDELKRNDFRAMINELSAKKLSRNTVRNAFCVIRGIFNDAIEANIIEVNPAARLGRFYADREDSPERLL